MSLHIDLSDVYWQMRQLRQMTTILSLSENDRTFHHIWNGWALPLTWCDLSEAMPATQQHISWLFVVCICIISPGLQLCKATVCCCFSFSTCEMIMKLYIFVSEKLTSLCRLQVETRSVSEVKSMQCVCSFCCRSWQTSPTPQHSSEWTTFWIFSLRSSLAPSLSPLLSR